MTSYTFSVIEIIGLFRLERNSVTVILVLLLRNITLSLLRISCLFFGNLEKGGVQGVQLAQNALLGAGTQMGHIDLDFLALINRVKTRRCMVAVKHADDDAVESAQFRHGKINYPINAA